MTPGGNNFNDFLEIVPTREITIKTETTFLVFSRPWPWNYFFDGSNAAAYNSTHLNPARVTKRRERITEPRPHRATCT